MLGEFHQTYQINFHREDNPRRKLQHVHVRAIFTKDLGDHKKKCKNRLLPSGNYTWMFHNESIYTYLCSVISYLLSYIRIELEIFNINHQLSALMSQVTCRGQCAYYLIANLIHWEFKYLLIKHNILHVYMRIIQIINTV